MSSSRIQILQDNIGKVFSGRESLKKQLLIALLSGGHILIEDVPGVGKTTLARALADSVDLDFARVQFTPDTLPTDILGTSVLDAETGSFRLMKGPIFHSFLLADEINRSSPKTQSALLEAMEEHQVTIDGTTIRLEEPFMVVATQNPVEMIGTYPLPEAEMDRFFMKMSLGYPEKEEQISLARKYLSGELEAPLSAVVTREELLEMMQEVKKVIFSDELVEYAMTIAQATREFSEVSCGISIRAGLDLLRASQASAYMDGRDFVIPEDVIEMAKLVLPHRIVLTTEARLSRFTGYQIILKALESVKRPK